MGVNFTTLHAFTSLMVSLLLILQKNNLISNNNLNLLAADVVANGEINMEAVDQLLITAGEVK